MAKKRANPTAKMLEEHPAPWKFIHRSATNFGYRIVDANGDLVFYINRTQLARRIVAAINKVEGKK